MTRLLAFLRRHVELSVIVPALLLDGLLRGLFNMLYNEARVPAPAPEPPIGGGANGPVLP